MIDRGLYDDKLIYNHSPIPPWKQGLILLFFMIYAMAKSLLNLTRCRKGCNSCEGWHEAEAPVLMLTGKDRQSFSKGCPLNPAGAFEQKVTVLYSRWSIMGLTVTDRYMLAPIDL